MYSGFLGVDRVLKIVLASIYELALKEISDSFGCSNDVGGADGTGE